MPDHPLRRKIRRLHAKLEELKDKKGCDFHQARLEIHKDIQELEALADMVEEAEKNQKENEKLHAMLLHAKEQIEAMRAEIDKLTAPPSSYGVFFEFHESSGMATVSVSGRKMKVSISPSVAAGDLKKGQYVILNEALNIIEALPSRETCGEIGVVDDIIDERRIRVIMRLDEKQIFERADHLLGEKISIGNELLCDTRSMLAIELLEKSENKELWLEEVPDITYEQIGGLSKQIQEIYDVVELPMLAREDFKRYVLTPPKGLFLYGPPGCGKTLIAKAMLNNLATQYQAMYGKEIKKCFINVAGPSILNKYVGESERLIRKMFEAARTRATEGYLVVMFFDEADALFQTRGTQISSDVNNTIVPQFLAEMDGMVTLANVLLVLASNRKDMIDPAVLRAGRIDSKILIARPDKIGAKEIFTIYLLGDIPLHPKYMDPRDKNYEKAYKALNGDRARIVEHMIDQTVRRLWASAKDPYTYIDGSGKEITPNNGIAELTFRGGDKEMLYLKDIVSGAMIANIVAKAKTIAIKRKRAGGVDGICTRDLCQGIEKEMVETQDIPEDNETAQTWLNLQGRKGIIVHCRSLASERQEEFEQRKVEEVSAGHYF